MFVEVGDHHSRASIDESGSEGTSDPAASPGHDGHSAFDLHR